MKPPRQTWNYPFPLLAAGAALAAIADGRELAGGIGLWHKKD
jgi:hypothetical protein